TYRRRYLVSDIRLPPHRRLALASRQRAMACPELRIVLRGHAGERRRTIDVARFWSAAASFAFHRATHQLMPLCSLLSRRLHHPEIGLRWNAYPPTPQWWPHAGDGPLRSLCDARDHPAATWRTCRRRLSRRERLRFQPDVAGARISAGIRVYQETLVFRTRRIERQLT